MPDPRGIQCTFTLNGQTTSMLTCGSFGSVTAYSGQKEGRNNPKLAAPPDIGPIPPGTYYIVDRQSGGHFGWIRDLYAAYGWGTTDRSKWFALYSGKTGDETFVNGVKRGGFRLHPEGPMRLSEGCITVLDPKRFDALADAIRKPGAMTPIPGGGMAYGTVEVR